jgi:cardiolipin synthase
VKLLIQPDHGIAPLLEALDGAKKIIRILIFRFDRPEIERALLAAVRRGVEVHALIAYTNQGEEKNLRRLETRLLGEGITVARTADDLVRYHGKMVIVDDKTVFILAYNFTHLDIDLSRSFGVAVTTPHLVKEAVRLFECDSKRHPFTDPKDDFVISPVNARERLTNFIVGAEKQLRLYEMKISDREFLKQLNKKISQGVDVRVISRASAKNGSIPVRRMPSRLHLRCILRDGHSAFLGSQSLRKLELEARREIGIIFEDKHTVKKMAAVFETDWKQSEPALEMDAVAGAFNIPAKKVAREVIKHLDVQPILEQVLERVMDPAKESGFEPAEVAQSVREAFRDEVQGAVTAALHEMVLRASQSDTEDSPDRTK